MPDDEPLLLTVPVPRSMLTVIAPPPVLLSQRNVEQATGVPPAKYLQMIRREDFKVPVMADGKLRFVRRDLFVAWMETHCAAPRVRPVPTGDDAASLLLAMGARRG